MNKNVFLIILIGLITIIYIINNYRLLTKINENFDAVSDNANRNISKINSSISKKVLKATKSNNSNKTESELLDLLKSHIESEIDQITKSEIKTETESEIESEMIDLSNMGGWITVVVIIILIFCCSSCIMSIFTPSTPTQPVQPVQPIVYQNTSPLPPPPVYSYPPQAYPYSPYPPPPNPYS